MFYQRSIILAVLATTCFWQGGVVARALIATTRSTDVTCGGQFPKAGDGFAQRPDGCSSWNDDNPSLVRDKWGSANFGGVCDNHDRCYYTVGASVEGCNNDFCGGLKDACRKAYCKKILGTRVCEPVTYGACTTIAEGYCAAVRLTAGKYFPNAQNLQKRYEMCIAENGGITPPPPPVLCSNGQPEGVTWKDSRDGSRCTSTTFGCRNGKITVISSFHMPNCIEP